MDNNAPSILKSTVIGGVAAGVASSIPFVNCLNLFCCALVIAGGFLAGFLYSKECARQQYPFGPANGATVGLVSGLFYAVTGSLIQGLYHAMGFGPDLDQILDQIDQAGMPPESTEWVVWAFEKFGGGFSVLGFLVSLLIAAVFCTVGGLIAGMSFKVEPAPPAPGMTPPPPGSMNGDPGPPPPPQV